MVARGPKKGWLWHGAVEEWWDGKRWTGIHRNRPPESGSSEQFGQPLPEGQYDVRRGAVGYAPIVSVFGSLAVAAIVIFFSAHQTPTPMRPIHGSGPVLGFFAVGLLVVGLLGSLAGAFGLAAIGAERDPTANLAPAIMFIAVPVSISIASIFGAFEVLAAAYDAAARPLFLMVVGVGGAFAALLVSGALADSTALGPRDPNARRAAREKQWLKTSDQAGAWFLVLFGAGILVLALAGAARLRMPYPQESVARIDIILGAAAAATFCCAAYGQIRTLHFGWFQGPLKAWEAFTSTAIVMAYFALLILTLP